MWQRLKAWFTHPTIDAMQAQMLREVRYRATWARMLREHRKKMRAINQRGRVMLFGEASDAQSEIDRINALWSPTTKRILDDMRKHGPLGTRKGGWTDNERARAMRDIDGPFAEATRGSTISARDRCALLRIAAF